jgi:hypothetical protein
MQPTQRLTENADAKTASALSFYPTATKGFASHLRRSLLRGRQEQRARRIPHAEWPSGRHWPQLSDSLGASGKVVNRSVGIGAIETRNCNCYPSSHAKKCPSMLSLAGAEHLGYRALPTVPSNGAQEQSGRGTWLHGGIAPRAVRQQNRSRDRLLDLCGGTRRASRNTRRTQFWTENRNFPKQSQEVTP